ncbi:hypothetical protein CKO38_06880 [Rhodospirillum rubrum]|uniref:DUF2239 family protein n=1 Tax=Rhodospirillum rubrum TaxID=1085 RepID=UPI001907CC11|nr:DUF2239 family protein [Rhodospirillum rubrum]MBK1666367.1 hypothetical protein [Rhodospirillum rubrum]MBK1676400.1 hypothetical protein [Rhodospirillum rubrum]
MTQDLSTPCTAFDGSRRLLSGPLIEVALAVKTAADGGAPGPLRMFDDTSGRAVALDLRGGKSDLVSRLVAAAPLPPPQATSSSPAAASPRGRGRPKLGVVAREVTLLPRHWDWLAAQPGGASAVLRDLVEEATSRDGLRQRALLSREAAHRFVLAMAGDLPGHEEAARALLVGEDALFAERSQAWPADIRQHAQALAFAGPPPPV